MQELCIEPYEMPWLEKTGVTVIRKRVEDVDKRYFLSWSVVIFSLLTHPYYRPQGDVLFEYLELLLHWKLVL